MSPRPRMAVVGARARMRPERAQRSGSIGRTLAAASASCEIGLSSSPYPLLISPQADSVVVGTLNLDRRLWVKRQGDRTPTFRPTSYLTPRRGSFAKGRSPDRLQ